MIFLFLKKCVTTLNFFKLNIIKLWTKFNYIELNLIVETRYIFLMDTNFDKSTIRLHFFFYILHVCKTSRRSMINSLCHQSNV